MCSICENPKRADIENAILALTSDGLSGGYTSIDIIADTFDVSLQDLKMHALFHTPLVSGADIEAWSAPDRPSVQVPNVGPDNLREPAASRDSLSRQLKLREADLLTTLGNEYLVTLKNVGRRINKLVAVKSNETEDEAQELKCSKYLTKPMVDMYLGLGIEIRQAVKAMADLNQMLHGPEDNLGSGIAALARAIKGSSDVDG